MAVSLICWGGLVGKSVSINPTTDYVALTRHGLRDGKGVQFSSGTLPIVSGVALTLNTTYYAKRIDGNNFELYYELSLTTKVNFTSSGASIVLAGAYFKSLSDTSRWGTRIYDSLYSCISTRTSASTPLESEIFEIGESFIDDIGTKGLTFQMSCPVVIIRPINAAGHNGVYDSGYVLVTSNPNVSSGTIILQSRVEIYDITFKSTAFGSLINMSNPLAIVDSCMLIGSGIGTANFTYGIRGISTYITVTNNLIVGFKRGLELNPGQTSQVIAHNTLSKNETGVYTTGINSFYGFMWNNKSVGNVTDWGAMPASIAGYNSFGGNAGGVLGDVWKNGANTALSVTTADLVNYAGNDFRPISASPAVDAGTLYYNPTTHDIASAVRPNYNNGGAASPDVGCFEFDHGYGPWPVTATLTLTGLVSGSDVVVLVAGTSTILTSVDANAGSSWGYTYSTVQNVDIGIIKPGFKVKYIRNYPLSASNTSIPVEQQLDPSYS